MALTVPRSATPLSDILEWLSSVMPMRGAWSESFLPVEEYVEDDHYVVRADIPGVDPNDNISLTVNDGVLTIHAERTQEEHDQHRSEVHYGEFTRQLRLPRGCHESDVTATYAAGVLTVSVPMTASAAEPLQIPVARGGD